MSKSMGTMRRSNYCGTLRESDIGKKVTICGWVQKQRNLGALIFADIRDRSGICQAVFYPESPAVFEIAETLRSEFVVGISGVVRERESKNPEMETGSIEILAEELVVFSEAQTPPFMIEDETKVNDALRLKHRYLDLRRSVLQKNLILRHNVTRIARDYYDKEGFLEIETPMLIKSTPEGARDYLVPSRVHPGKFYALPQSPQVYKQLLMLSGMDRYMQIVRCFRDEDLRADRQPEFTQIDLEMSFVDVDDILAINEGFLKRLFAELLQVEIKTPFLRMPYEEAMERFGSDKPDLRFGFELRDLSEIMKNSTFKVFADTLGAGGSVRAINVAGYADRFSRKEIDSLGEFVKTYRAHGLAFMKVQSEGQVQSPIAKFLSEEELAGILSAMDAHENDLILFCADKTQVTFDALGALRCECAKRLDLLRADDYKFLWVTDFPLFEYDEEENRYAAKHHPFTSPVDSDMDKILTDPKNCHAKAYDVVLNGVELGGGSIRIFDSKLQSDMFEALGFSEEEKQKRFGFLIDAFAYGTPPHGGMAYGLDRIVMLMTGSDSIRDVIAFPKVQNASELMSAAPDVVDQKQIEELNIGVVVKEEEI